MIGKIDKNYGILFLISLFLVLPYLSEYIIEGHDIEFHMTNVKGMMENIKAGNIFPSKVLNNELNNFGYGAHIFYPSIMYYITSYVSVIFSLGAIGGVKLTFFLVTFFSAISMYCLINGVFKNRSYALLGAIFYVTSKYFIGDIFTRFAFSELGVFIFAPLTFLGVHKMVFEKKIGVLVMAAVGMINSHTVLTIYLVILVAIYMIMNIKYCLKVDVIKNIIIAACMIMALSLPTVVPMLEHKILGSYAVFEEGHMTYQNSNIGENKGLKIFQYLNPNDIFFIQSGLIVFGILGIYSMKKIFKEKEKFLFVSSMVVISGLAVLFTLNIIDWERLPKVLSYIQFPWRLCVFSCMGMSVIGALGLSCFNEKYQKVIIVFLVMFTLNTVMTTYNYGKLEEVTSEMVKGYADIGNQKEYLPTATHDYLDYYFDRNNEILIVDETVEAKIEVIHDNTPNISFEIESPEELVVIEIPRIYYLGYSIIYTSNGESTKLEYSENEKGFIEIRLNSPDGIIDVEYTQTAVSRLANWVTGVTVILLCVGGAVKKCKQMSKKSLSKK